MEAFVTLHLLRCDLDVCVCMRNYYEKGIVSYKIFIIKNQTYKIKKYNNKKCAIFVTK